MMTEEFWREAMWSSLGVPHLVHDKAAMGQEILSRTVWPAAREAEVSGPLERDRWASERKVLDELPKRLHLEPGLLDRHLAGLDEDFDSLADRLAGDWNNAIGPTAENLAQVLRTVLRRLIPQAKVYTPQVALQPMDTLPDI